MYPFDEKRKNPPPLPEERTADGSWVRRYSGTGLNRPQLGVSDESARVLAMRREAVYEEWFGPIDLVSHEVIPMVPHIDVHQFKPGWIGRDFWTLITSGMSDLPMVLPRDAPAELARTELVFYCESPKEEYFELLRVLARFPHDNRTWLGPGHTMPNGNPPGALFEEFPNLDTLLFSNTIMAPDSSLGERLQVGTVPVNLLWVVPITAAECNLKLTQGLDAIYDLFDAVEHPPVFGGERPDYV